MILKDGIRSHRKVLRVGAEASWLWVCAIDYSRDQLLDGFVPIEALPTLAIFKAKPDQLAQKLCDAGLFEVAEGGYRVHDFLDHNDSAETVREKRARDVERKRNRGGFHPDSVGNPNGEKDARAGARERVGVGLRNGSGSGSGVQSTTPSVAPVLVRPTPSPAPDPLSPSLWDVWRETGEAHGYPQSATPRGSNLQQNIATIRGLVRSDAELRAALAAWWPSPTPREDQRTIGHFAGHLPGVLKHVRAGSSGPWAATATNAPTSNVPLDWTPPVTQPRAGGAR